MATEIVAVLAKSNIPRLILLIAGVVAMVWAIVALPVFMAEKSIVDVAMAVMAGEVFKSETLKAIDAQIETKSDSMFRSSVLGKVAAIRLRRAEDAISSGNLEQIDQSLKSLASAIDESLVNAPSDPFLWLVRFWLDSFNNGVRAENLRFLRMSYDLGPYEGWIAIKRSRVALADFPVLPKDLAELTISEFVGLVHWGLLIEAAEIAAGPAKSVRSTLFPRLKDLEYEQRRAFASLVYERELDDVLVPGINPPPVNLPLPVLPPGF